ncbi:hypothetical protein ACROYT_G002015 [Oculina patagonica]
MARILNSDHVNRIHRARDDSGQNEAERLNACIGEALVDGGAMQWKFHDALDGLTQDEIAALSLNDIKKRDELAMEQNELATEQNACTVAQNVAEKINHEPDPAGDYMQSFLTPQKNAQFFLNTEQLHHSRLGKSSKANARSQSSTRIVLLALWQDPKAKDNDGDPSESVDSDVSDDEDDVILFEFGEPSDDDGNDSQNDEI